MQAYDELLRRLGHLHSGLAREKRATGRRPEEERSHVTETRRGLRATARARPSVGGPLCLACRRMATGRIINLVWPQRGDCLIETYPRILRRRASSMARLRHGIAHHSRRNVVGNVKRAY